MDNGFQALKAWLARNQEKFSAEKYTTQDIANLAIACGYDRGAVAQWQTSQKFKEAH